MSKVIVVNHQPVFDGENSHDEAILEEVQCKKEKCAFWLMALTIEGLTIDECAINISALKNAEGKIPV
jgi:hypothetical protein